MSTSDGRNHRFSIISGLIWLAVALLLAWVIRTVPLREAVGVLSHLKMWQIAILLAGNAAILLALSARWWLILRALGHRVPYFRLSSYRMAAFGISYFTPGQHFGGEPLQIALIHRRHAIPIPTATASVALEKLLEVAVNLSVLAVGVMITLSNPAFTGIPAGAARIGSLGLLSIPMGILGVLRAGGRPVTWALNRLPPRLRVSPRILRWQTTVEETETLAANFLRDHPASLLAALLASILSWAAILGEMWLAAAFLGAPLTPFNLISVAVAARVAILLPSPGALGTLEASQVWMFGALGLDPALGLSLSLVVRIRDILFGLAGVWWGMIALRSRPQVGTSEQSG